MLKVEKQSHLPFSNPFTGSDRRAQTDSAYGDAGLAT